MRQARSILNDIAHKNKIMPHKVSAVDGKHHNFRLSYETLHKLPATVQSLRYDPKSVTPGILHIGTGNFALAHLASYIHDVLATDPRWGIVAASIRSEKTISALRKQDGMYVLVVRENQNRTAQLMAPVVDTIYGPRDPKVLINKMADEKIKMVTVTITNKGYCLAQGGRLDASCSDIQHDIRHPERPKSIYGYLAAGLALRAKRTANPLTILSLDNIEQNSSTFKKVFIEYLTLTNQPALISYVEAKTDFLTTLVDRITPEPTDAFREESHSQIGFNSTLTIGCESFRQLVVEQGRFPSTTPNWSTVGVQVVPSCGQYWQRKFYCLNAGHLIVSQCGMRLGCKYIHEAMRKPAVARLLTRAQREWGLFLSGNANELDKYAEKIRTRFSDASLNDTVRRVGARATSKISDRLLSSVERALSATNNKTTIRVPAFATALYLHNLSRNTEISTPFEAEDAQFNAVKPIYQSLMSYLSATPQQSTHLDLSQTRTLLNTLSTTLHEPRFAHLSTNESFVRTFAWSLLAIHRLGLEAAVAALLEEEGTMSPKIVKRVASTEPKRELWKKVHVGGKVKIVRADSGIEV